MDSGFQLKHENPKINASCLSKLFFLWMIRLFHKGRRRGLEVMDLYKTLNADLSKKLGDMLGRNWEQEITRAKETNHSPSLLRAISKTFLFAYMLWGILLCLQMVGVRSFQPVVMAYLIRLFSGTESINKLTEIYISSTVMILMSIIQIFLMHHTNFGMSLIGMRVRIAVSSLVFRKFCRDPWDCLKPNEETALKMPTDRSGETIGLVNPVGRCHKIWHTFLIGIVHCICIVLRRIGQKITRLNQNSLGQTAAGHVVNLLSNDVTRFDLVVIALHALWIMPIQVMLVSYFLWQEVGVSCLAGILSMALLSLPLQGYLGKVTGDLRYKIAHKTDKRVKLMSEIVSGIQVIKMYAWEIPFEKVIRYARATEISDLTKTSYLRGFFASCMVFIERATLFLTLICYVLLGNEITADKVFSMAQFYNILQFAMAIYYPIAISYGAETWISIKRLQEFLLLEEMEKSTFVKVPEGGVQIKSVYAAWCPTNPTLNNISIHIPPGILCAVVGPVGAGKSSILQLLLGELPFTAGTVAMSGRLSYAAQEPWLFAGTVRNNILFGQRYSKSKYDHVVKVCSLERDFDQFPYGDRTIVGERGVSLSGGQRARVNLARAIYRDADTYLLDDPLSAVDTHVGRHLFDKCINKYLKGKTRILVTHQLQYLKKANLIVVINEGRIEAQGSFQELSNSELDFTKILVEADESHETEEIEELDTNIHRRRISTISLANSTISETIESIQKNQVNDEQTSSDPNIDPLKEYFKAARSICLVVILILIFVFAQSACAGADYWVAYWTQEEHIRHETHIVSSSINSSHLETFEVYNIKDKNLPHYTYTLEVSEPLDPKMFPFDDWYDNVEVGNTIYKIFKTEVSMYIYGSLIVAAILLTVGRSLLYYKLCMVASKNLHAKMFHALLRAPMRFFDTNPSGRVLNRFSKDMGAIDDVLPRVLLDSIQITLVMAGILVNVSIANPYIIIPMFILGIIFLYLRNVYLSTAKNVKHIEGVTKSPMFSHINSTLHGLTTIRAAKVENVIINEFDHHQDVHTSAWFLTVTCFISFGLWLDIICVIFIASVTFSFVILNQYTDSVDGSMVGLAISQSLILTGMLQHGMRQTSEVVNQLTSVERVLQYTTIENEKPFETPNEKVIVRPWPSNGLLEFRNLSLRYVEGEQPVLKNLNIIIRPGEKIGIVGRTGAGKSSLIAALFRLTTIEGSILIDGVDTKDLGLTDLRKNISIIPQEPVLFSATMRYNLDPFGEFNDSKLWAALDEVELRGTISSLEYKVSEGGANFSLGQRQLICLARAILRNNKILVLDEATANVDPRTDSFIQVAIRKKFRSCTVLTIAHRLNTIMDSDRVLVMSFGNMVEFDHPHKLLQIPDGHFYKMVEQTGPVMSMQLKDIAKDAYNQIGT